MSLRLPKRSKAAAFSAISDEVSAAPAKPSGLLYERAMFLFDVFALVMSLATSIYEWTLLNPLIVHWTMGSYFAGAATICYCYAIIASMKERFFSHAIGGSFRRTRRLILYISAYVGGLMLLYQAQVFLGVGPPEVIDASGGPSLFGLLALVSSPFQVYLSVKYYRLLATKS